MKMYKASQGKDEDGLFTCTCALCNNELKTYEAKWTDAIKSAKQCGWKDRTDYTGKWLICDLCAKGE